MSGSNANPYQFTGRENDGTGLYFYRARYYSPIFERFISQDPVDLRGGSTNYYVYALDNPLMLIDPLGTCGGPPNKQKPLPCASLGGAAYLATLTANQIAYGALEGAERGALAGLGVGLVAGVPVQGLALGTGLGVLVGQAYGAYEAVDAIETLCDW